MKKEYKVTIPMTPNFIMVGKESVPLIEFTVAELRQIAKEWGEELVKKAENQNKV